MENRKVVGIDYYGYILYEDDAPAFNSPFTEVIAGAKSKEEKKLWDKSSVSMKYFNNVILNIEYNGMEDGFDYVFKIPLFLEAKLMDIKDRDNIWQGGWTFNDRAKHFTPIKVGEHNVDIPMLKTETKDEYLSRKCMIAKDNGEHIEPYMPEIKDIKDKVDDKQLQKLIDRIIKLNFKKNRFSIFLFNLYKYLIMFFTIFGVYISFIEKEYMFLFGCVLMGIYLFFYIFKNTKKSFILLSSFALFGIGIITNFFKG